MRYLKQHSLHFKTLKCIHTITFQNSLVQIDCINIKIFYNAIFLYCDYQWECYYTTKISQIHLLSYQYYYIKFILTIVFWLNLLKQMATLLKNLLLFSFFFQTFHLIKIFTQVTSVFDNIFVLSFLKRFYFGNHFVGCLYYPFFKL